MSLVRLRHKVTVGQIARRMGLHYPDVYKWSANQAIPPRDEWDRMLQEFDIEVELPWERLRRHFTGHHKRG